MLSAAFVSLWKTRQRTLFFRAVAHGVPRTFFDATRDGLCYTTGMQRETFRHRLYPTAAQETVMNQTLGECRWLYNRLGEKHQ